MTQMITAEAPAVSVVVIFKDAEAFLEEAIESVRAQTFGRWELLLVDDGSRDQSTSIALRHAERDAGRVRYLDHPHHANLGMSATRNLGVSHARGALVAFLDADDMLFASALERQVALLEAHPRVGMVYGPLEYWYGWTGLREDEARNFIHPVGVPTEAIYEPPSLIEVFIRNTAFAPAGMLLRRTIVERVVILIMNRDLKASAAERRGALVVDRHFQAAARGDQSLAVGALDAQAGYANAPISTAILPLADRYDLGRAVCCQEMADHIGCSTIRDDSSFVQKVGAPAERGDRCHVVTDKDHSSAVGRNLLHSGEALLLKREVADRQHLVHD